MESVNNHCQIKPRKKEKQKAVTEIKRKNSKKESNIQYNKKADTDIKKKRSKQNVIENEMKGSKDDSSLLTQHKNKEGNTVINGKKENKTDEEKINYYSCFSRLEGEVPDLSHDHHGQK